MADYPIAFFAGMQLAVGAMVYAVALTVILGRWIVGDESAPGMLLRMAATVGFAVLAIRLFGTIWYWVALTAAVLPLTDWCMGKSLSRSWLMRHRHERVGQALQGAAEQPSNPIVRLGVARARRSRRGVEAMRRREPVRRYRDVLAGESGVRQRLPTLWLPQLPRGPRLPRMRACAVR